MKKFVALFTFILFHIVSHGQQKPQYTQYIFNNFILNPAISGIENYTDVKIGYRNQWQGLEGAPVTSYLSIHAPIGKKFIYGNANSSPEDGNNPMSRSFVHTYKASEPHHGIGFHVVLDKAGPITTTDANLTYAYHLGITERMNMSFGIAGGISMMKLDYSIVKLENNFDPAIADGISNLQPDLGAGIWLYGPSYFAGISAQSLLRRPISFTNEVGYNQGKEVPHIFFTTGYKFYLSDNIAAIPSTMLKYVSPAPLTVDANLKLAFKDKFWLGGSFRKDDAVSAMAGFNFSSLFSLSYSYDYTTTELQSVSNGTHEIVLGFLFNNRYKVICPQKNW